MNIFHRNPEPPVGDDDRDGLPDGIESPPVPRLPDIDWAADVAANARLGLPSPGSPSRPLYIEENAVKLFEADMHELTKWGRRQRVLLPSLYETATNRRATLDQECLRLKLEITATETSIEAQRDQLVEQDRKFPKASEALNNFLVVGTTLGFGLEVIALQPVIWDVFSTQNWTAWGFTALSVGAIGYSSWWFGGLLHRWLAYEGPSRLRRALGWKSLGYGIFATLALVAVVAIRILGRNQEVTSAKEAAFAGCLYAAVQGLVQLAAMTHGWRHEDPRVRELANTETHLSQLRSEADSLTESLEDTTVWAESLNDFHLSDWLTSHRAQLAEDYAADDLEYRNLLNQALVEAQHHESVDMLHILPLPRFVPPIESDPGDATDWINGFILPL